MLNRDQGKDISDDTLNVRTSDKYQEEYDHAFIDKWDELIDWDDRAKADGEFLIEKLNEYGARKVLDVATGSGFHSIQLIKAGFEVTSVDGCQAMLVKAFENARRHGYILRTIHSDWRWLKRDVHDLYDAVICLGNSFAHLHQESDRRKALAEYYSALRHDGILMLDQRNYDAILDHKLEPSYTYYYCGKNVQVAPEYIDDSLARFKYDFSGGGTFRLSMFPLRKRYTERLLKEVGFQQVSTFSDFKETYRNSEPDFFIHVAEKKYRNGEAAE